MGICVQKQLKQVTNQSVYISSQVSYPRTATVVIKKKDSRGRVSETIQVSITHTNPLLCVSEDISISFCIWGSGSVYLACILPGLDPYEKVFKVCQDLCFFSSNGTSTIAGLFDGHGKEGEHISNFCIHESDEFFSNSITSYEEKPQEFLNDLLSSICMKLKETSSIIDISNSGCSCVLALMHKNDLYIANIGNARAVLGTQNYNELRFRRPSTFTDDKHYLKEIANNRAILPEKEPTAVELSCRHTTENRDEFMRILRCGGRLQQNSDKYGNREGPYYIWKNYSSIPGLIVSRSIGNIIVEDIGVVPEPHLYQQTLTFGDEFLVLASEGVWAVMNNADVINYIAAFKDIACKTVDADETYVTVTPKNSCIAQLVCEEARLRWLALVENENKMIDDISCIILEFDQRTERKSQTAYRMPFERIKTLKNNRQITNPNLY